MSKLAGSDYAGFLVEIKTRIRQAQYQALRAVNKELLILYWDIGESIHRKQEALGWGKAVVENLARDLRAEFPGQNGFSARNLWNMKEFYTEYSALPKLQPLVAEISWAKNLVIMSRCKDLLEREFYLRATARFGWTKAVLQHQIDNKSYEKYLLNQTNFDATLPPEIKAQAAKLVGKINAYRVFGVRKVLGQQPRAHSALRQHGDPAIRRVLSGEHPARQVHHRRSAA